MEPLPGAEAFDPRVAREIAQALVRRERSGPPRTRHLRADGTPRYTNRLVLESSPYLLQHAHNPMNWYPWGEEAFARARAEGKPVLLSVGYSTCHWCHVMEEESFEDEEIAAYVNRYYVAIKVDREERPDVDETYMSAVVLLTGNGGWPMTAWLTPEREPFFAGTYFPPRDGERGARVGFLSLLQQLRAAFDANPLRIATQASEVAARVRALSAPPAGEVLPDGAVMHAAFAAYAARFDGEYGGFGKAPKFPMPAALDFLLRYHRRTGNSQALAMVSRTLERMAAGGIYDHVGGGFHRYATDAAWLVPHFEKMLYDNAQLASVYLSAYQATRNGDFARVTRDTLDYVGREMTAPEGGFLTATDADSAGEEGLYYVWTPADLAAALDSVHASAVAAYYGVHEGGNFEGGATILHVARPLAAVAADVGITSTELDARLRASRELLRAARARRAPPATDTKILAAWNGLMISAFSRAGAVLDEQSYVDRARAAATFVLEHLRVGGRLRRSFAEGAARQDAFLDDYAFVAAGLVDLYEATFEPRWLREALALHATLAEEFWDPAGGGFFTTSSAHDVPLARRKPDDDGAVPSGNAVAAETLLRLAEFTGDESLRRRSEDVVRALATNLARAPTRAPRLLAALDGILDRPREIVIVHPAGSDRRAAAPLLATVHATLIPNRVLTVVAEGADLAAAGTVDPAACREARALRRCHRLRV